MNKRKKNYNFKKLNLFFYSNFLFPFSFKIRKKN